MEKGGDLRVKGVGGCWRAGYRQELCRGRGGFAPGLVNIEEYF